MELCGSKKEHRHLNVFPYAPHLAFWQMHYASLGFNTFCLSTGGGKTVGTEGNLRMIRKLKPEALIGMPTFVYHLLTMAVEQGIRWTNLERIVLGGEKVPLGLRRKLRALCNELGSDDTIVMGTYGFTEAKTAWPECAYPAGAEPSGYHLYPDLGIVEIIDPESGVPVGPNEPGEIVYTPLDARGTVVIRYRTGDLIDGGLVYEPCPHCGRTTPRLVGRISRVSNRKSMQLDKLKGTLVDFNELEHLLDDEGSIGSWQLELRKANDDPLELDELIVHVTPNDHLSESEVRRMIEHRFLDATEIRPNQIVFHDPSRMREMQGVGASLKEERVVDHRPTPDPTKKEVRK
jgi:phenylacetate-coenzyme A ligase PaaK-like adenylate-forming protein